MGSSQSIPEQCSYIVPNSQDGINGAIHRHPTEPEGLVERMMPKGEVETVYDTMKRGYGMHKNAPCLGYRPFVNGIAQNYKWISYQQVMDKLTNIGQGIMSLKLFANVDKMRIVGIYSKNTPEWTMTQMATYRHKGCIVPLYDTMTPENLAFIVKQTELSTIFSSGENLGKLAELKKNFAEETASLKNVVVMSEYKETDKKMVIDSGLSCHTMEELLKIGEDNPCVPEYAERPDVALICYTSGTTSFPKGALLTHRNIMSISSGAGIQHVGFVLNSDMVHLSYLPLCHMYEQWLHVMCFMYGGRVGYGQGDPRKIPDDIKTLRPTIFASVPRVYNRIYDKMTQKIADMKGLKKMMISRALKTKLANLDAGRGQNHRLWDRLIFSKVRKELGFDRCVFMLTGSAPMAPEIMRLLRVMFCCPILEGYGLTETSAGATVNEFGVRSVGHVGGPAINNELKLVSVEDMGYSVEDTNHNGIECLGRGEVCIRGFNIFPGYFRDEEKTRETIDEDGWLRTGDIGVWLPNGCLKIVDRKKNIFKLAQGEYVACERVENAYTRCPFVGQVFVTGDSTRDFAITFIIPDEEYTMEYFKKHSLLTGSDFKTIIQSKEFRELVFAGLEVLEKEDKLRGFEKAKNVRFDSELWSADNALLTPTFKLKRPQLNTKYKLMIKEMYEEGPIRCVRTRAPTSTGAPSNRV
eukprot:TRINITY_DN222_c0_g1_i2.p1 TRINITY_DN222_c0_g1~~TRINITY_DN222_c0_g1_i2.p1  ORF type:complete len:694 (+),score=211.84 TRINITY_DN222_c0_g1_i2:74-2155(+)